MTRPSSARRIWIRLTADRKRFGLLVGAICVGLLLWGRLIVVRQPPRMALANDAAVASTPRKGADNQPQNRPRIATEQQSRRSPIAVELSASPRQDPFVISPHYFPKPAEVVEVIEKEAKSGPDPAEEAVQAETRIAAQIRSSMERLKLEAAFGGNMAVISGKKYRLGDVIVSQAGSSFQFQLVEIRQRSVMLECEGRQFELQMATPGS